MQMKITPGVLKYLITEASGARWPSRSSKSVAPRFAGRLGSTPRRFRQPSLMIAGEGKHSTPKTPTPNSQTTKLGIGSLELEVTVLERRLSSPGSLRLA